MIVFSRILLLTSLFIIGLAAGSSVQIDWIDDKNSTGNDHENVTVNLNREKRSSAQDNLEFQIWSSANVQSDEGVLMTKKEGGSWAPVCRQKSSGSTSYPTTESGNYICERMDYRILNEVSLVWNSYSFAEDYSYRSSEKVYNLECSSPTQCTYDTSSSCRYDKYYYEGYYYRYYYTKISCTGCKANTYISDNQCLPCPAGATSPPDSTQCNCAANWYLTSNHQHCFKCPTNSTSPAGSTHCNCTAGYYFLALTSQEARCSICPPNSYSAEGALKCTNCVPGSSSTAGSEQCECEGGLYWEDGVCKGCSAGYYSYSGATECFKCPGNLTSNEFQSFCTCLPGSYWKVEERNCVQCPEDHYTNSANSTQCPPCPQHSTSTPGSSTCSCNAGYILVNSTRCESCPENYYSTAGSLNCTRCPHFTAAKPASGHCYRCTLGEYWKNHTCFKCPEHLYGDGVQCHECPTGFQVDRGFCHKDLTQKIVVAAFVAFLVIACVIIAVVVFYRVKRSTEIKKRKLSSEREGEKDNVYESLREMKDT